MDAYRVTLDKAALARLQQTLQRLQDANLSDALESIATAGEAVTRERISDAGRLDSDKPGIGPQNETWPAWTDGYAKTVQANKGGLWNSGTLHDAITSASDGKVAIWGVEGIAYARVHQWGYREKTAASRLRKNIPARPYIGYGKQEEAAVYEAIADFMRSTLQ